MTGVKAYIEAYVDSKTLYDVLAKDGGTEEKRLKIDIFALKEIFERGELTRLIWIRVRTKPADTLTTQSLGTNFPLCKLME